MSNNHRFTQKWDCFQSHSDIFFLFLKHVMKYVKTRGKMLIVEYHVSHGKIFGQIQ